MGLFARRRLEQRAGLVFEEFLCQSEETDAVLKECLAESRQGLKGAKQSVKQHLENRVLAVACVAAVRCLGLKPHYEQVFGAVGLLEGYMMEMATGEGKTLTLAMASVPVALSGRIHHILTANDYLSARDADTMSAFYQYCGVEVSSVTGALGVEERKLRYQAEVVYTSSKELVADYLRDTLNYKYLIDGERRLVRSLYSGQAFELRGVVQRGLESVFVDEADHILIDEAVTPLLISRGKENPIVESLVRETMAEAESWLPGEDFHVDAATEAIRFTATGRKRLESWQARHPALGTLQRREEWLLKSLRARHLMIKDRHYMVQDEQVVIIDQNLGRAMPNRSWSQGMHACVEVKEGVPVTPPAETLTGISFQKFFRRIPFLSGLSGTLAENGFELFHLYGRHLFRINPHRPCRRSFAPWRFYWGKTAKLSAAVACIGELHSLGLPVLVGTLSIRSSMEVAKALKDRGLPYRLLNAAQDEAEAEIIAGAGQSGRVTIATNMAGRGVDIQPEQSTVEEGGLQVVQLEVNPVRRIDRQLYGRCSRQGQPGRVHRFTSLDEDQLLAGSQSGKKNVYVMELILQSIVGRQIAMGLVRHLQARHDRQSFKKRAQLVEKDKWLDESIG